MSVVQPMSHADPCPSTRAVSSIPHESETPPHKVIKDRCDHTEPNRADSVKQTLTRASDIKQSLSSDLILANSVILRADTSLPLLSSVVRRVRKKTKNADSFTRLAFISVTDHGAETKGCRCNQAVPVPQLLFTN